MSRSIADRLRSLDVKSGMTSPASAAVAGARQPAAGPAQESPVRARPAREKPAPAGRSAAGPAAPPSPAIPASAIPPRAAPAEKPAGAGEGSPAARRGRGRPPRHETPGRQTTIRLSPEEWAALQAQVTRETLERGERRYAVDIIRDAVGEYLARHGGVPGGKNGPAGGRGRTGG